MAEKEALSGGNSRSAQSGLAAPSAGSHSVLQDGLSFTPLDYKDDGAVQPFTRSPKLQRKIANAARPSQVHMCDDASTEVLTHA